jgi:hypothetical protein
METKSYIGDVSTYEQPPDSMMRDAVYERWVADIDDTLEPGDIVDLTAYDNKFETIRYNCMDAALGLIKSDSSRSGHGGQPGQFANRTISDMSSWSCPTLKKLVKMDGEKLNRAIEFDLNDPDHCDGSFVYMMTTDASQGRGDFHFLLLAKHLIFRLTSRIANDLQEPSSSMVDLTSSSVLRRLKSDGRVYKYPSTNPMHADETIPMGCVVFVTDAYIFVHKRGTATPMLFTDNRGAIIKDVETADFAYTPRLSYTEKCGPVCMVSRKIMTSEAALPERGRLEKSSSNRKP